LTRGFGVSSKLSITAAVSSVSLNWGMVVVLRVTPLWARAYTRDMAMISGPRLEQNGLFGYQDRPRQLPETFRC
jgi:hypothetical protein